MEPLHATWRNASSPSSHYPLWAGMLLKTIFSQGKSEMKCHLGNLLVPCQQLNWSSVLALRTTLVAPLGRRHLVCSPLSLEVEL